MTAKIKDYFKRYPRNNEVYECGGVLFHTSGAAQSYGRGEVKKHVRGESECDEEPKKVESTEETETELTYKDLLAKCNELGIETADKKKGTLIAALKEYDDKNKE